jgi:hypothetical protein
VVEDKPSIVFRTIRSGSISFIPGYSTEETFYLRGSWRRIDFPPHCSAGEQGDGSVQLRYGPRVVTIVRPDLGQMFDLNPDTAEYASTPYPPPPPKPLTTAQMAMLGLKLPDVSESRKKPTFRIETTTVDTHEREEMFGYMARRIVTTKKEIPFEGSLRRTQETVIDGWYIDLDPQLYPLLYPLPPQKATPGKSPRVHAYRRSWKSTGESALEVPEFVDIGEPAIGFAVQEVRTFKCTNILPDGTSQQVDQNMETLITFEERNLDPMLFEVPPNFKRVDHINRNVR